MLNFKTKTNGNVVLVEPNSVNINNDVVNGIPQYQDMYIFAELTAKSKGRTVIINGNATSEDSKKINLLGNNQDDESLNNPNRLNFTTNYYDGSTSGTHYEGFGISSIKIVTNSSYVPQVNIQFIDIRGLAFFNQNDSPYRVLFDFPPPIFTLTVKGYYGKAITYELHLVKYTTEFSAANGNFIIDAQFVAVTFAPLADILFRYVVNTPLINNEESMTPNTGNKPQNTYELIMKLKNLYAAVSDKLETSTENKQYFSVQSQIEAIIEIADMLQSVIDNQNEVLKTPSTRPYLIIRTPKSSSEYSLVTSPATQASEKYNLQIIESLSEYNEFIKQEETTGIKKRLKNRLYITYLAGTNLPLTENDYSPYVNKPNYIAPLINTFAFPTKNYGAFETALTTFSKTLSDNVLPAFGIKSGDIATPEPFTNGVNVLTNDIIKTEYYGMDITEYYHKIYKKNQSLAEEKDELSLILSEKINNMVSQNLGMTPTIYNIFEVILNDVDKFFSVLSKTSKLADDAHNISDSVIKTIASNNIDTAVSKGNVPDHIYPFPLIIEESAVYGGRKQERVAPIELSKDVPFPELDLVTSFMDTFVLQRNLAKLYDARINQNDDGTYKWIPVSPLDSVLGGATPESPYLNLNNDIRASITNTLLERFYVLSQGSIYDTFYGDDVTKRNAYIDLYANSEAINVVTTLFSKQNAQTIEIMADQYKNDVQAFYDYAKTLSTEYDDGSTTGKVGNLINFPAEDPKSFVVTPSQPFQGRAYVNKKNSDFSGLNWYTSDIVLQGTPDIDNKTENSDKPIDNFNKDAKTKWYKRAIAEELIYDFTQENVIFLRDINADDDIDANNIFGGLSMFTRYLTNKYDTFYDTEVVRYLLNKNDYTPTVNPRFPGVSQDTTTRATEGQIIAYNQGNQSFHVDNDYLRDKKLLKYGNNIFDIWVSALVSHDIVDALTGDTNFSTILILSNFGTTASPFNKYPNSLNSLIFDTPAAVEVPEFYAPYLGGLLTAIDDGWVNEILSGFTGTTGDNGVGAVLSNKGFNIFADLHDDEAYLSDNDKAKLKQAYSNYGNNLHGTLVYGITELVKYCRKNTKPTPDAAGMFPSERQGYRYLLNSQSIDIEGATGHGQSFPIIESLMERKTLVNYSQITFEMVDLDLYPIGYLSISGLTSTRAIEVNQRFFSTFFRKLGGEIFKKMKSLKEEAEALKKAKGDKDIINQLYYSFKNINDKWLTGTKNSSGEYPFNKPNKKLINSFAFVDRAMNPIGETVINGEVLVNMLDDPNISLFGVITQLLSLNGFEFFPLQNFMRIDNDKTWEDSFKIHTGAIHDVTSTAFVCMYIGGSSSYPSNGGNGFVNDGIIDISEPGVTDFLTSKPENLGTVNDAQEEQSPEFPWRQVRAFRVRFGEQNQSMFTDIKIDSKEYPETNESIQILSRLAGDNNPDAPVPKGQNLYNLYENRSYKATVTAFGNAMIQPTQYFQLENVPLFNGAYIILSVEHNITPNKMTTSFSGTKLLKYPVPRVLNPMAFTNYNPNASPGDAVRDAAAFISNREETHFNSMYDNTPNSLKIE